MILCRAYTLPQRYTYALDPQRLAALEAPQGMVSVRLVEAKNVPRMDLVGKTDCFCKRAPTLAPQRRCADHCMCLCHESGVLRTQGPSEMCKILSGAEVNVYHPGFRRFWGNGRCCATIFSLRLWLSELHFDKLWPSL